jgi:hypothetical protein
MYDDEITRIPRSENELWDILEKQFEFIRLVLWETPVETEEDALNRKYDQRADGTFSKNRGMTVIRYRGRNEHYDQRNHYLDMGRELLPYIHQAIDQRTLTPEFVQQWGKIMFCHGYIASYYFDDTDDLSHTRAGHVTGRKRSKHAQRKWLAHLFTHLMDQGATRAQAEERITSFIKKLLASDSTPEGFSREWFGVMITRGDLAATYDAKHFYTKQMRQLVQEPTDDIPPIPEIP